MEGGHSLFLVGVFPKVGSREQIFCEVQGIGNKRFENANMSGAHEWRIDGKLVGLGVPTGLKKGS